MRSICQLYLERLRDGKTTPQRIMLMAPPAYKAFMDQYVTKVFFKKIPPLEDLTQKYKNELWAKAKEFCQDKETAINACKLIYITDVMLAELYNQTNNHDRH